MSEPKVAIVPQAGGPLGKAVEDAGGTLVPPGEADALVWTDPSSPESLRTTLESSPARWIQLPFAGIERFVEAGVIDDRHTWTCAKGIYGPATGEHALTLTLAAARLLNRHIRSRTWLGDREMEAPERRLGTSTVMIVGTGGIGGALRDMLVPIGPRIIGVNRSGRPFEGAERIVRAENVLDAVGDADFIVLAAPATDATRHLVDMRFLEAMNENAWVINVARGSLIDTGALVKALEAETIGGAALDVTEPEPLPDDHPLWRLDSVIITGHTANTWPMAVPELARLVERNVARFGAGEDLEGIVDPRLGY